MTGEGGKGSCGQSALASEKELIRSIAMAILNVAENALIYTTRIVHSARTCIADV